MMFNMSNHKGEVMKNILVSMVAVLVAIVAFDAQALKRRTGAPVTPQAVVVPAIRPVVDVAPKVVDQPKVGPMTERDIANLITTEAAKSESNEDAAEYVDRVVEFLQKNIGQMRLSQKFAGMRPRAEIIAKEQQAIQEAHHADLLKQANEKATTQEGVAMLEQYEKDHPGVDLSDLKLKVQVK